MNDFHSSFNMHLWLQRPIAKTKKSIVSISYTYTIGPLPALWEGQRLTCKVTVTHARGHLLGEGRGQGHALTQPHADSLLVSFCNLMSIL